MAYDDTCYVVIYQMVDGTDWLIHCTADDADAALMELRNIQHHYPSFRAEMMRTDARLIDAEWQSLEYEEHARQH